MRYNQVCGIVLSNSVEITNDIPFAYLNTYGIIILQSTTLNEVVPDTIAF